MKSASLPDQLPLPRPLNLAHLAIAGIRYLRGRHLFLIDLLGLMAAIWLALDLSVATPVAPRELASFLPAAAIPIVVHLAMNAWGRLYSRVWVHASVLDLVEIVATSFGGTIVALSIVVFLHVLPGTPSAARLTPAFWFLELLFAVLVLGGARFAIRAVNDLAIGRASDDGSARVPALLFGAGREGVLMARSALADRRAKVLPVGFLDPDHTMWGSTTAGLKVFGALGALDEAIRRTGARMLLITMSNAPGSAVREVMAAAQHAGLEVRRVPAVHELLDGTLDTLRIRPIRVDDLLTREQVTTHAPGVEAIIKDQIVMVTGAGGSIGSELARQIFAFRPRKLILVDRAESPLYMIERELELRSFAGESMTDVSVHMVNVVSRRDVGRLIKTMRPSVIFHAAACKHVPMMEEHPSESVHVNVAGTQAVLDAAVDAGVERFVLVSTDKAVEPSSVMGATKRLAEWLVADTARSSGRPYVAVRFGNVLGSAGSVLPIFERQLERGEPLTVTHPEMTRYFMTIQEAGWLILDAAAIGGPGDLFVLDMGEPVKIIDMARDLVRLAGRDPNDVEIVFTGLRPGEKLSEKLYYDAEMVRETDVPKIARVLDPQKPPNIRHVVKQLLSLADGEHEQNLRERLFAAVSVGEDTPAPTVDPKAERPMVAVIFPPVRSDSRPASASEATRANPMELDGLELDVIEAADHDAAADSHQTVTANANDVRRERDVPGEPGRTDWRKDRDRVA
jgi:FlaA1/EpsC-like NDP-sugar epimerase